MGCHLSYCGNNITQQRILVHLHEVPLYNVKVGVRCKGTRMIMDFVLYADNINPDRYKKQGV
jgi:hypothetical protein